MLYPASESGASAAVRRRTSRLTLARLVHCTRHAHERRPETAARLRSLGYGRWQRSTPEVYTEPTTRNGSSRWIRRIHARYQPVPGGRPREAITLYRDVIAKRPDLMLAYQHFAFLEWEMGDLSAAIATLRSGIERAGPDPEAEARPASTYRRPCVNEAIPLLERAAQDPTAGVDVLNASGSPMRARPARPGLEHFSGS